jgi:predicted nucleic acid-binding protein
VLDVNVLIALIDPLHTQHDAVHAWFSAQGGRSWAACAITENGVLRIVGHLRYPNSPGTPAAVAQVVSGFYSHPGHAFWLDGISFFTAPTVDRDRLLTSARITDSFPPRWEQLTATQHGFAEYQIADGGVNVGC